MRVLVTGGAGLIGMSARRHLTAAGHIVTATDIVDFGRADEELVLMPLADFAGLERLIEARGIEAIVHGGGISGPVMGRDDPLRVVDINVMATAHLLDIVRRFALQRFVLLSSHVVYGDCGPAIIDEERAMHPGTSYAASKIAGEALVESFAREFGISALSLRLTRVYGAYRRDNCFLRNIILDAAAGHPTVIPCDPYYLYHYVYVDDVCSAIVAAIEAPVVEGFSFNITSGEAVTMPEVVRVAKEVLPQAKIELIPGKDAAPEVQTSFGLRRAMQSLRWEPRFPLAKGFRAYAESLAGDPQAA